MKNTDTFAEFWQRYLRDHAQPGTRTLHFVGNGVAVAALILAVVMLDPMIAIIGALLGYVFAWSGHFLIEGNRPSMFDHPIWSFQCDVRMLRLLFGGRLDDARTRAGLRSERADVA
jgi:hypothetical protein